MPWPDRVAILLDGEYVKKVLGRQLKRFPTHSDVMAEVQRILVHEAVKDLLYRPRRLGCTCRDEAVPGLPIEASY